MIVILVLILTYILILIGLDIEDYNAQVKTMEEAFESSNVNNSCRKRNSVKHFKHMLYLAEVS